MAGSALQFRCPRCFTPLKAKVGQAGSKRRCPRCQWVFAAPTAKETAAREEVRRKSGYDILPLTTDPGHDGPPTTYLAVVCSLCGTRMYGTAEQIGHELVCPDCGTRTIVLPPVCPAPEVETGAELLPVHEEYAILEGVVQPAPDSPLVNQVYIPVVCPVCKTRMLATPEEVGQELVCPDCQTRCQVLPPAERPTATEETPSPREGPEAEYGLVAGVDQPPPGSEAYAEHVAIQCSVCHTRLHFTLDQVGQTAICPDCQRPLVVPPPKPKPPAYRDVEEGPVDYEVDSRQTGTPVVQRPPRIGRKYRISTADRPVLPAHPFLTGVLRFPFYREVFTHWLGLSVAAPIIAALGLSGGEIFRAKQGFEALLAVLLLGGAALMAAFWIAAMGSIWLVIVSETASGNDHIQQWPEMDFVEWISNACLLVNSLMLAAAPGAGIACLDPRNGPLYVGISIFVGFPVLFLSMLESNSCMSPWSTAILRSLWAGRRGWTVFYLQTAVGVAAAVGLTLGLSPALGGAIVLTLPFDLLILIVYARLLGRLGWYAADALAQP